MRVQRRVDKALTSGCKAMGRFLSSLPVVVHAKQRQGSPQSGIMFIYFYYWRHFISQACVLKIKKRACKPPNHTKSHECGSPDEACNLAGSPSWTGSGGDEQIHVHHHIRQIKWPTCPSHKIKAAAQANRCWLV